MSNDKPSNTDPLSGLALYQRFLRSAPVGFPLKQAGFDEPGSLFRLKSVSKESRLLGKFDEPEAVPLLILLRVLDEDFIEVCPCWCGLEYESRQWGPHDLMIKGSSSPYAMPWNFIAGHVRVLFWNRESVFRPTFEKTTRLAAQHAANITHLLKFYEDEEGGLDPECQRYRDKWEPRWRKVLEKIGLP